ncbi:MAG: HAD family hydrolase [Bacteroidota bacterium]
MIPIHLKYQIEALEGRLKALNQERTKIALFDLDNTLLVGDIGEAVFACLLADGAPLKCTWEEYQSFLRCDVTAAYRLLVESMAGLAVREVEEATVKVMKQPAPLIEAGTARVAVPKPHPGMKKLVLLLQKLRYKIYVISASNQISVRIAAEEFFGIPPECSFGIESKIANKFVSATLVKPFPISAGKVDVYHKYVGILRPLVTATDSLVDAPMLGLTDPIGLSLWVGKNRSEFKNMKERIRQLQRFCFVQRPRGYSLRKRVRTFGEQRSREVAPSTVFVEM